MRTRRQKVTFAFLVVALCAIVGVILFEMMRNTEPNKRSDLGQDIDREQRWKKHHRKRASTRSELKRVIHAADNKDRMEARKVTPGHIAFRVVQEDDRRRKYGLPPVMRNLPSNRPFRPPRPGEVKTPALRKRYQLDAAIHQATTMARHAATEAARFRRQAERSRDEKDRAMLLQAARDHAKMADKIWNKVNILKRERGAHVRKYFINKSAPLS